MTHWQWSISQVQSLDMGDNRVPQVHFLSEYLMVFSILIGTAWVCPNHDDNTDDTGISSTLKSHVA